MVQIYNDTCSNFKVSFHCKRQCRADILNNKTKVTPFCAVMSVYFISSNNLVLNLVFWYYTSGQNLCYNHVRFLLELFFKCCNKNFEYIFFKLFCLGLILFHVNIKTEPHIQTDTFMFIKNSNYTIMTQTQLGY